MMTKALACVAAYLLVSTSYGTPLQSQPQVSIPNSNPQPMPSAVRQYPSQMSSQSGPHPYGSPWQMQNSSLMNTTSGTNDTGCDNLMTNLTESCWNKLDVSGYLDAWWKNNSDHCAFNGLGFASCYQQSLGLTQQACDNMGPSQCSYPDNFAAQGYTPLEAYTLYSIFAVWQWYYSIYEGIENADVSASGPIGNIVREINPQKASTQFLADLLAALSAFAPMISVPTRASWGIFKDSTICEAILRQSPNVMRYMNPTGTLDSQIVQWNEISNGLSIVKTTYQQNLTQVLQTIQNDYNTFKNFVANGTFIAPKSDLQAQTVNLTTSLQTYIVGSALTSTNIIITMARDTNPKELAANGSADGSSVVSCPSYDQNGMCNEWWYDNTTNIAYGLTNIGAPGKKYHDILTTIFNNGWTTPELLFRGAKTCQDYIAVEHGDNTPTFDTNSMAVRCVPNTQICVFNQDCAINDQSCLYTTEYGGGKLCQPPTGFLVDGCKGNGDGSRLDFNVPNSYLGPVSRDLGVNMWDCIG